GRGQRRSDSEGNQRDGDGDKHSLHDSLPRGPSALCSPPALYLTYTDYAANSRHLARPPGRVRHAPGDRVARVDVLASNYWTIARYGGTTVAWQTRTTCRQL